MEQILVPFHAADHGRGEPSWGQRELWGVGTERGRHVTFGGVTALPRGTSVEGVADSIGRLMARHPTLRTRFHVDASERLSEQVVAAEGELAIALVDADEPEQAAIDTVIAYDQAKFDFAQEWPLRMAVIRHHGVPTHMAAVYNHIALDARGLDAMLADMTDYGAPDRHAAPPAPAALQPLEQAAWQLSAAGRRQSGRALRYWNRVLREAPSRQFRKQRADESAPYIKLLFESEAARLAVLAVSERTKQSSGHILLAAYAVAVAHLSGTAGVALRVVVDNRFRPGLSDSVSTVSQMGLWSIDTSASTFDTVLARALTASLDTYMNAYYDPEDRQSLLDSIQRERGEQLILDCCYNDRRRSAQDLKPAADSAVGMNGSGGHPSAERAKSATRAALREALTRSTLRWEPWTAPTKPFGETLYLHIDDAPTAPALTFAVTGDSSYLAPERFEECAHLIEDVLVQAALDPGAAMPTL